MDLLAGGSEGVDLLAGGGKGDEIVDVGGGGDGVEDDEGGVAVGVVVNGSGGGEAAGDTGGGGVFNKNSYRPHRSVDQHQLTSTRHVSSSTCGHISASIHQSNQIASYPPAPATVYPPPSSSSTTTPSSSSQSSSSGIPIRILILGTEAVKGLILNSIDVQVNAKPFEKMDKLWYRAHVLEVRRDGMKLSLTDCNLSHLPSEIDRLISLASLGLGRNRSLTLPDSIWHLTRLNALHLGGCNRSHLPSGIGGLVSLATLNIEENNICTIPDSISNLPRLGYICLNNCAKLRSLPKLPTHTSVYAARCPLLESLPLELDQLGLMVDYSESNKLAENNFLTSLLKQLPERTDYECSVSFGYSRIICGIRAGALHDTFKFGPLIVAEEMKKSRKTGRWLWEAKSMRPAASTATPLVITTVCTHLGRVEKASREMER
ncbi:hypothetical protein RHSIM_Rhsim01G0093000 [Rhododendron simsii]|uniref:Uncharacterized protein n=1 Tax=Rhododendron simsii TaxID=118357 RepID=A0A834HGM6_RHOSS|nr:hypothetical protein RHSIM_Rhsim01G0093000 [Rhododendron simsii]